MNNNNLNNAVLENNTPDLAGLPLTPAQIENNTPDIAGIALTAEQAERAYANLADLRELAKSDLTRYVESQPESESSIFNESYPDYVPKSLPDVDSDYIPRIEVFKSTHQLFEAMGGSEIVSKLVEKKGILNLITSFHLDQNTKSFNSSELKDLLNTIESSPSESVKKSLGDFTLREVAQTLEPFGNALKNSIESVGLGPKDIGSVISILFMYHGICKGSEKLMKGYAPSNVNYSKLTTEEKIIMDKMWLARLNRFRFIAAPLLVLSLYTIKQTALGLSPSIKINMDVLDTEKLEVNKSIAFLAFFKKLPDFIGKFVILILITSLIKYLLNVYSIQLIDPYYIKIICVIGILVGFILALNNLVQLIIYSYFKKDRDVIIPTKLPKIVYNYLNDLKILTKLDISYNRFFLMHLGLYIFIIFIFIVSLILI